jgi:membrane protein implicated in regulation of membrane protease activity
MADYLVWTIAGLLLVISELVTGTFYLLVLGIAGLAGAAVAYLGLNFWAQAVISAVIAVGGVVWIHQRRKRMTPPAMPSPDAGQPVIWESWVHEAARLARVSYRGASWEARVDGESAGQPGEVLYIRAVNGNTLEVTKNRPV